MQRIIFRSSTRLIQQQITRRLLSSSGRRIIADKNASRSTAKWLATGLTTAGTIGFLLSSPIVLDAEGKELPAEAKEDVEVVVKDSPRDIKEGEEVTEQEEGQSAAYDPVTGEINWDCPCLGGMAHGPCGEEFKEAFSCFIYSELEPKGIDCIEKFKNMQNCFRKYPEVYSEELRDEDEETVVETAEDNKGNVVSDEVVIDKVGNDVVAVDEKITIDLKDVDEFVKDEAHPK